MITELDEVNKVEDEESTYTLKASDMPEPVIFKAYEEVKVRDYVVYINDDDIYHCTEQVFRDRNEV